jgi:prepilin-type N-terminal cleavage/methylation domain-containing protein
MSHVSNRITRIHRGFSLIEALASVIILGVGIASVLSGLGAVSRVEVRMKQVEAMTRLAQHKFDELVATSTTMTSGATQNGDFNDENNSQYLWSCDIQDTGVTNLEAVTVTVTLANDTSTTAPVGKVSTLLYVPPPPSTTTSATPTARPGG